jgi:predicted O-linked N-acetylglucosamine transferase (SPINDLY family)
MQGANSFGQDHQSALAAGLAWHRAGQLAEAEEIYRRIPPDVPQGADALFLRGMVAYQGFRPADAIPLMARAIALQPGAGPFYLDLGNALHAAERLVEAARVMQRALAFGVEPAAVSHNLDRVAYALAREAVLLREAGDIGLADRLMRASLVLGPGVPEAQFAHGTVRFSRGHPAAACTAFRRAADLRPGFAGAGSDYLFALCFRDDVSREAVFAAHRAFDARYMRALPKLPARSPRAEDPQRPLVVGYVSPDFRMHPGGNFLSPILAHHDPGVFRTIGYYSHDIHDAFTALCSSHAHAWVPCKDMSDADLARRIRDDRVDILVECAGHMARNRLAVFARRPAPVQVSFPLYPNTTGLDAIDYRIGDPHLNPAWLDPSYAEKVIRLPETHECYRPGYEAAEPAEAPPALTTGMVTFGSFNNAAKLSATTVGLWAAILRRVPASRLVVKWHAADRGALDWLPEALGELEVDPARIVLRGKSAGIYAPYRDIDICLDTFPANGGTTSCDALWMGVPVVTRAGETTFSRVGLCLLSNVGLTQLVARDARGYIELAVALATDLDRLAGLRCGLRQRFAASPMMNGPRYVRYLETAYREAWRRWCTGAAPAAIEGEVFAAAIRSATAS